MRKATLGNAAFALLMLNCIAFGASAAEPKGPADCETLRSALKAMLETEYAFGQKAQASVAGAFLEYLAEDSWVLNPAPAPGRPIYQGAKESKNTLEWYPTVGDVAPSGDLGFTAGPWVYTNADSGKKAYGHFLTIWKRDAACQWHAEFDGGISHAMPQVDEAKLLPDQAPVSATEHPPANLVAHDAAGHAASDFQDTARRDGIAAALRTYGRDVDFVFFTDEQLPIDGAAAASQYLSDHPLKGVWKEVARGRSADASLMYSVGELTNSGQRSTHAYVQIWQYAPKVANWGLRVLLINPLPAPKAKS
jgi:ketosteroid isomerase-like protein